MSSTNRSQRACYARFALDQTLESFQRGHVEAFVALQGVPRTILYDNLKSVVVERMAITSASTRAQPALKRPAVEAAFASAVPDGGGYGVCTHAPTIFFGNLAH